MVDQKLFTIYCRIWRVKFLLISQNAKVITLYVLEKLGDPSRSIKSYWATLRTLWNRKKVPSIAPLLVNNKLRTEFEANANILNKNFVSQYTTVNNSVLPSTLNYLTDDKLSSFNIFSEVIFQLIKNLDPNKAHRHDEISVKNV